MQTENVLGYQPNNFFKINVFLVTSDANSCQKQLLFTDNKKFAMQI